jgi:hypothetical protein
MSGLSDSITVGILLLLVFGAVSFYLYSRVSQAERRVSLLENLLMDLKMSTEAAFTGVDLNASYNGPTSVRPVSEGSPLSFEDVDTVKEEDYAAMLSATAVPSTPSTEPVSTEHVRPVEYVDHVEHVEHVDHVEHVEQELRPMEQESTTNDANETSSKRQMDVNYESMTIKELQTLARERGMNVSNQRKGQLIDSLKKLPSSTLESLKEDSLPGATVSKEGYSVQLEL